VKSTQLGNNIRFLRKMRGMSQQQLATELDLKRNNIASYEAGIVEPRALVFIAIAEFFRVTPQELLRAEIPAEPKLIARVLRSGLSREQLREHPSIQQQLNLLERQTADMEKVIQGFQEFYRQRRKLNAGASAESIAFAADFEQLFEMLAEMLKSNRQFIANHRREE